MLEALQADAATMMLFLRNVEHLEILHWREGEPQPALHFTCRLSNAMPQLRAQRSLFSIASAGPRNQAVQGTHRLDWEQTDMTGATQRSSYLVSQLKGTGARAITLADRASKTFGAPAIPWGAVAAQIATESGQLHQACACATQWQ